MNKILSALFALSLGLGYGLCHGEELAPVTYPLSEVRELRADSNGKDYQLFIQLPQSYKNSNKAYPLILVNDSRFAFPVASGAMALMGDRVVKEAIVVGISYAKGDDYGVSRTRDYTPTYSLHEASAHSDAARAASGHAKEYVQFIEHQVFPLLKEKYRIDNANKIFVGHSFGGLLGAYIVTNKPSLFDHYIIGSPSLWYDKNVIFKMEAEYAKHNKDLKAHVCIYVDADSTRTNSMVADVLTLEKSLRSRNYKSLRLDIEVLKNENHHSVFPALLSKGLMQSIPI